jgi:CHAD domain-containing protein
MNLRQKLRDGWDELSKAIDDCSAEASERAVHHARTRSRRMEALVGAVLATHGGDNKELAEAGESLLRRLKKIRREAGVLRDLDIHVKSLELLTRPQSTARGREAAKLMRLMTREREGAASGTMKKIAQHRSKLERSAEEFLKSFDGLAESQQEMDTLALATAGFLEASGAIPALHEANLHDFRKRLKMSRYIAEANPRSPESVRLAKKLVRVQDAIGTWHDWDVLMAEAEDALGKKGAALMREIGTRRVKTFREAMKITRRMKQQMSGTS